VAWRGGTVRALVLAALALLVTLIGPSRVYLGQHWPSDMLGAYLFASLWLAGTIEAHLFLKPRLDRTRAHHQRRSSQEDSHGISSHHQ
jgi:undecaprenyl-diphosphatase